MIQIKKDVLEFKDPTTGEFVPYTAITGERGAKGETGNKGATGDTGYTPEFSISSVETLAPGSDPQIQITGDDETPEMSLGIPKGHEGDVQASEFIEAVNDKAEAITNSASGNIATFSDGSNAPFKNIKIGITPKKTVIGTGKNLLDIDALLSAPSGQVGSYMFEHVLTMTLSPNTQYTLSTTYDGETNVIYLNGTQSSNAAKSSTPRTTTTDSDGNLMILLYNRTGIEEFENKTVTVQLERGDTATTYEVFYKIYQISGYTAGQFGRRGKNMVNSALYTRGYVDQYGAEKADSSWRRTAYIKVNSNTTYTFSVDTSGGNLAKHAFFDFDMNFISSIDSGTRTFTTPNNTAWVRFSLRKTTTRSQLEAGSVATAYEPHNGNTYNIQFPQEAGTVYGGTLTLNEDGSGVLTVDRLSIDLGSLDWTYIDHAFNLRSQAITGAVLPSGINDMPDLISSCYLVKSYVDTLNIDKTITLIFATSGSSGQLWVHDSAYTDSNSFKMDVTGQKVVYELATPITYTLTPITPINSFDGVNNVWADTGNVTVEYRADSDLYFNNKLDKLKANIATIETSPVTSNHIVGDFFIYNDKLYKVTSAIAVGDTVLPNANCVETTVAEQILSAQG